MVMSLVQSARMHGHDPWVYLKDVLERLLSHPNHRIGGNRPTDPMVDTGPKSDQMSMT